MDTVGKNESRIAEYVKNQLKEDEMEEQLRIPSSSPFTGDKQQSSRSWQTVLRVARVREEQRAMPA